MKKFLTILFYASLTALIVMSCMAKKELTAEEFKTYIRDESHGLRKSETDGDFSISVNYIPSSLLALQQVEDQGPSYDSLNRFYSQTKYFSCEISKGKTDLETFLSADPEGFATQLFYLDHEFGDSFRLITGADTLSARDFSFVRSYGMGGRSQFLVAFEPPRDDEFRVEITGHRVGFGKVQFDFQQADLDNIPALKINSPR